MYANSLFKKVDEIYEFGTKVQL